MKLKVLLLTIMASCLPAFKAFGEVQDIPKKIALQYAKTFFKDYDADFYTVDEDTSENWVVFADLEPLKGLGHEYGLLTMPKKADPLGFSTLIKYKPLRTVPSGTIKAMEVKDRYGKYKLIPQFVGSANNITNSEVAERTYAVILSGGYDAFNNYERYWNDCSFLYKTLRQSYGVPQENIKVIMSDGTDSGIDMHTTDGHFISSPLDLDGDGVNDIQYSATNQNVRTVLNSLSNQLKRDDHLLFFVIDHGGSDDKVSTSYINLWGEERLYDYELASCLTPLLNNDVSVNVVLGQCYSGGFVDNLSTIGCVVATASSGSESSYGCGDRPYDEFVYHWTSAINGRDPYGIITDADYNNDGKITMDEAFLYANEHDRYTGSTGRYSETPQYYGGPYSYADHLSFSYLPKSDFLMIRDNIEDTGEEPNTTTTNSWNSPDIWVRNQEDDKDEHEAPYYSKEHQYAFVYRRVFNAGEKEFRGEGRWTMINWAYASTGINAPTWRGREWDDNYNQTGGNAQCVKIPKLAPAGSVVQSQLWSLPESLKDSLPGYYHFCLYCRILDKTTDEVIIDHAIFRPLTSNKAAQKNLCIIRKEDLHKPVNIFVRNITDEARSYALEIQSNSDQDKALFDLANVEMMMSSPIYSAWERGGLQGEDIQIVRNGSIAVPVGQAEKVRLLSAKSKVKEVQLESNEFDKIQMKFNFHTVPLKGKTTYTIDLVQKDEKGVIVGGETFMIEAPTQSMQSLNVCKEVLESGKTILYVDNDDFCDVQWYTETGELIGETSSIEIEPTSETLHYKAIGFTENGEAASETVILEKNVGIGKLTPNGNNIEIVFLSPTPKNSTIEVLSIENGGAQISSNVEEGIENTTLNDVVKDKGIYTVRYMIDNKIVDTQKIMINN